MNDNDVLINVSPSSDVLVYVPAAKLLSLILDDGLVFARTYASGKYAYRLAEQKTLALPQWSVTSRSYVLADAAADMLTGKP